MHTANAILTATLGRPAQARPVAANTVLPRIAPASRRVRDRSGVRWVVIFEPRGSAGAHSRDLREAR